MLILTRREGEYIHIQTADGQTIRIKVHRAEGNQVKLGIDAPEDYAIWRKELLEGDMKLVENV